MVGGGPPFVLIYVSALFKVEKTLQPILTTLLRPAGQESESAENKATQSHWNLAKSGLKLGLTIPSLIFLYHLEWLLALKCSALDCSVPEDLLLKTPTYYLHCSL